MFYHYLKLTFTFLSQIAWPIIVLVIIYWLREPIGKFLSNIRKVTFGGAEIESEAYQSKTIIDDSSNKAGGLSASAIMGKMSENTNKKLDEIVERENNVSKSNLHITELNLFEYAKLIMLLKTFERIYQSIYGSQIKILINLRANSSTKEMLKSIYDQAVGFNKEFFAGYTYVSYLNFLFANDLISENPFNGELSLTDLGNDFLIYIETYNLRTDLPN